MNKLSKSLNGLALLLVCTSAQAALDLSNTPLFLSASVPPNIMLLFDNSGSMENMTWATGFNPDTTYPDWSPRTCSNARCWNATDGNVAMTNIKTTSS